MDWSRFDTKGVSSKAAFEAFCCQVFEKWILREHDDGLANLYILDGRGGDGGVEAFASYADGSEIGLQAKWFDGSLDDTQFKQLRKSVSQAKKRHATLTTYVVALRGDPSDAKNVKKKQKSELDRWNEFVGWVAEEWPGLSVVLWAASQLQEQLQHGDTQGLRAYWFEKKFIGLEHWSERFAVAKAGWFSQRYLPDLHCTGDIERHLAWHVQSVEGRASSIAQLDRLLEQIGVVDQAITRLPRLPGVMVPENAPALQADLQEARVVVRSLRASIESGALASLVSLEEEPLFLRSWPADLWPPGEAPPNLTMVLGELREQQEAKQGSGQYGPLRDIVDAFETCTSLLAEVSARLPRAAADLRRINAIIGDPGIGKTHAVVHFVQEHLDAGYPALVIAARSTSPDKDWATLLGEHLDLPGWSAGEILDALESGTHLRRRLAGAQLVEEVDGLWGTPRALLVVDGLEEASNPAQWQQRLRELHALIAKRPRVAVVVSTRWGTRSLCIGQQDRPEFASRAVYGDSDAPIGLLFDRYCNAYGIQVLEMPWLADQLRTPLAVRMFVEENEGRKVSNSEQLTKTLPALIKNKIARMESELRVADSYWNEKDQRAFRAIRQFALASAEGSRLTKAAILEAFRAGVAATGVVNDVSLERLLGKASREYGFIDAAVVPGKTAMEPDEWVYSPAFHQVVDVLLAYQALEKVKQDLDAKDPPPEVRGRPDSMAILTTLLAHEGIFVVQSKMWPGIPASELTRWQLRAIADLPPSSAVAHADWLQETLIRSMPLCRMVLREVAIPLARWPEHPLGPHWVHKTLEAFQVAERDLFWSGPDYVPANHGAIWEGSGEDVWATVELLAHDTAESLPLLVAWGCATVVDERRVELRRMLSSWGAESPTELSFLLERMSGVNDEQVIQDLFVASAGAAMRCDPSKPGLEKLASLADKLFFATKPRAWRHNCVARHAARVIVERAAVCGQADDALVARARPPYQNHPDERLPIDTNAAEKNSRETSDILLSDLGWYVANKAIDGFFEDTKGNAGEGGPPLLSVDQGIRNAAAAGLLGPGPKATIDAAEEILREEEERRAIQMASTADLERMLEVLQSQKEVPASSPEPNGSTVEAQEGDEEDVPAGLISAINRKTFSESANALLNRYAEDLGLEELSPLQLRNGLIDAYVRSLGWDRTTFVGDPRGEKPGEILGADVAIRREYHAATHGSRSSVASFAEKYVWSAVNVVAGFLADRLPRRKGWGRTLAMADDFGDLGGGMPEPSEPECDDERLAIVESALWQPEGLFPDIELSEEDQIARANEWLAIAPWPEVASWPQSSPVGDEFIVLSAAASELDHDSQAEVAVWLQAFAVRQGDLPFVLRDAEHAGETLGRKRLYETRAGLSYSTYLSPSLAIWAPWLHSIEQDGYFTFNPEGGIARVDFEPLVAEVMWKEDREVSVDMPAPALRDPWKLTDSLGGTDRRVYVDRSGARRAYYRSFHDPKHIRWFNHYLVGERSAVAEAMRTQGLTIIWAARVCRETNPLMFGDEMMSGGPQEGRHWEEREWLVIPSSDTLESFTSIELCSSRREKSE